MSLHPNDFPPELLGKIFWHLTVPDLLTLKLVNRTFRDVVSGQPHLQYKCELTIAGLLDNPDAPGALFDRRTRLHKYRSRFDDLKPISTSSLSLGETGFCCGYETSGGVYVIYATSQNALHFHRPSSVSENRPMKSWSLPLPFEPEYWITHPPLDLLVLAANLPTRLYLMTMTTGEPHPLAVGQWIEHDLGPTYPYLLGPGLMVSLSDHLMSAWIRNRLVLWNWRTGAKIIDRNIHANSMAFIGDDHLLVAEDVWPNSDEDEAPNMVLLDTSVSADSPATSREVRFVCDPRYRGMRTKIMAGVVRSGDPSGVLEQDVPLYPDPSQRVIVLLFYWRFNYSGKAQGIRVVRSETLLRLARERGEGVVEWEAWEKFTVAPEPDEVSDANSYTQYSVSESRFVKVDTNETEKWVKIRAYDLSHWSRQHPNAELDGDGGSDEREVGCRFTQAVLEMPESMGKIFHAAMLHDSIVFFSHDNQLHDEWGPHSRGTIDIWSFW